MGQLVNQQHFRTALQGAVEVKLLPVDVPVAHRYRGQTLEPFEQTFGLDPAMRLDVAYDDVPAARSHVARGFQHGERLTDTGGGTEEDAQASAARADFFGRNAREQLVRIGSTGRVHRLTRTA